MKYEINQDFNQFEPFVQDVKNYFDEKKENIHKARNELKVLEFSKNEVVVKSYKIPNILNKIIYTFFRKSKAQRSYEYSLKIATFAPKPIAYVEFFKFGLLNESYFISEKFEYDFTIREPLINTNFQDRKEVLKAFARFTYKLHENEIYHKDYSAGNILVKKEKDEYIFKIVDINRMSFGPMSLDQRLNNFSKLWLEDEDLKIIIKQYCKTAKEDEEICLKKALNFSQNLKNKVNRKKRLKGIEVVD